MLNASYIFGICRVDPLVCHWTMRFEARHWYFTNILPHNWEISSKYYIHSPCGISNCSATPTLTIPGLTLATHHKLDRYIYCYCLQCTCTIYATKFKINFFLERNGSRCMELCTRHHVLWSWVFMMISSSLSLAELGMSWL